MSRNRLFVLAVLAVVFVLMFASVTGVSAASETEACGSKPTHQVRFFDFNDIPLFGSADDAAKASGIFLGEEGIVPNKVVTVPGGQRQKYLLCGAHEPGSGSIKIFFVDGALWAPEALVESVVARYLRD